MSRAPFGSIWPWLGLAALLLVADQATKQLILATYQLGDSTHVTSFFNVVRVHNTGAAFSFLAGASMGRARSSPRRYSRTSPPI